MIQQAKKGNYYFTQRGAHRGYIAGLARPIVKVFAMTGGKEFPRCDEVYVDVDGTERRWNQGHLVSTHLLFETEQEAIEWYSRSANLKAA